MTMLNLETLQIDDVATGVLTSAPGSAVPVIFLHGAAPGVTPYCGGAHLWGEVLGKFTAERQVLAPDLPGSGKTALPAGVAPTYEKWGANILGLLQHKQIARAHVVGHEEGGLLALWLAQHAPERVRSLSVVASRAASPLGDAFPNVVLNSPPRPLWSAVSQKWAFEQISYGAHHIDEALMSACLEAAKGPAHQGVLATRKDPAVADEYVRSMGKTKSQLFKLYRETGVPMPVQILWGSHDPLSEVQRGFGLYEMIARKQRVTALDVVNRTGNMPFREEPQAFLDMVCAFHQAVDAMTV